MADTEDWAEMPHEEALAYVRGLAPMTAAELALYSEESAQWAFRATGVYKLDVLQEMLDAIEGALVGDVPLEDFIEQFAATGLSDWRLETIFRTNLQSAFGKGNFDQGMHSDISADIWGWRYRTVGDDRVREEHEEMEGLIFAKGDGEEFFPPIDFNCRCTAEWITVTEAEEEGLETSEVSKDMRETLGDTEFRSPALQRAEFRPDLGDYDLALAREFMIEEGEAE